MHIILYIYIYIYIYNITPPDPRLQEGQGDLREGALLVLRQNGEGRLPAT